MIADDWETKELEVSITRKKFYEALSAAIAELGDLGARSSLVGFSYSEFNRITAALEKHLGL
jgi:hypothetical protein